MLLVLGLLYWDEMNLLPEDGVECYGSKRDPEAGLGEVEMLDEVGGKCCGPLSVLLKEIHGGVGENE